MKCPCYTEHHYIRFVDMEETDVTVPVCAGTKEQDPCNCGGDRCKCDFYSGIRENAERERLICNAMIAYDTLGDLIKELIKTIKEEKK